MKLFFTSSKGGKVSLAKVAADAGIAKLSKIFVGLGWAEVCTQSCQTTAESRAYCVKLPLSVMPVQFMVGLGWNCNKYDGSADFDLDASVFLVNGMGRTNEDGFIFKLC